MMNRLLPFVAALVIASGLAPAQEITLKVGDAAPRLFVSKWAKGGPIEQFEKGKIYVIECWATWCGPCRAAIPHVTKLQAQYKDKGVVVIGMNVWERNEAAVEPFLKEMGDKMAYAVALDDVSEGRPGKTAAAWLQAAGRKGIPCSFLVDKQGRIAWIGHPMSMDGPLGQLANDKFDAVAQARLDAKVEDLGKQLSMALREKKVDEGLKLLDELLAANPSMGAFYNGTKLSLLIQKQDYAAANALAAQLAQSDDTTTLARTASVLLYAAESAADKVDVALALKVAEKLAGTEEGKVWQAQSLLAKAYAANKQYARAVEIQTRVIEQVPQQMRSREEKSLEDYKARAK